MLTGTFEHSPRWTNMNRQPRGTAMSEELQKALESLGDHRMSPKEVEDQRISFVYGNGSADDNDTKESVRRAIEQVEMT
jgi:hypothetical protein